MSITVTLSRLEGNTSNMWVVIGVTSGNGLLIITTPMVAQSTETNKASFLPSRTV